MTRSSSTTTAIGCGSSSYRELAEAARAARRGWPRRESGPTTKSSSGPRTAPEWIVAFWGCLLARAVVVPGRLSRVRAICCSASRASVGAAAILVGAEVGMPSAESAPVWPLSGHRAADRACSRPPALEPSTPPTWARPGPAFPRGDHLHVGRDGRSEGRDDHPPQRAREHRAHRAGDREVPPVRAPVPSAALPEPAAAQPHVRPVDGDLRAADAPRARSSSRTATARPKSCARSSRGGCRCWSASRRCSTSFASTSSACRRSRPGPIGSPAGTGPGAGGTIATRTGCSAGSSGASSAAPRRSIRISRRSGASSACSSCRATA